MIPQRPKSKSGQLAEFLRARITGGEWPDAIPPERALAEEYLVSRTAIRKALATLRNEGVIDAPASTRSGRRVLNPSPAASRPRHSREVVFLTPAIRESPLVLEHLSNLRERLTRAGATVHVQEAGRLTEMRQPLSAITRLTSRHSEAIWILHKMPQPVQRTFADLGLPTLIFGSAFPGVTLPFVEVNFAAVARHAIGRCLARSYTRVALVVHRTRLAGDESMLREITTALDAAGAPPPVVLRHDFNRSRLMDALDEKLVRAAPRPQALLIANQHHLITAQSHLLRRGLSFPRDLALLYLNSDPVAERLSPLPDRYQLGNSLHDRLARAVQSLMAGESPSPVWLLPRAVSGETFPGSPGPPPT